MLVALVPNDASSIASTNVAVTFQSAASEAAISLHFMSITTCFKCPELAAYEFKST
jgi:hypothetical protein